MRENRAIVTFRTTSPIFIGMRSLKVSHCWRPFSVRFQRRRPKPIAASSGKMMNQYERRAFEKSTTICVRVGSWPWSCEKMFANTGTRKRSIPTRTREAKVMTTIG